MFHVEHGFIDELTMLIPKLSEVFRNLDGVAFCLAGNWRDVDKAMTLVWVVHILDLDAILSEFVAINLTFIMQQVMSSSKDIGRRQFFKIAIGGRNKGIIQSNIVLGCIVFGHVIDILTGKDQALTIGIERWVTTFEVNRRIDE